MPAQNSPPAPTVLLARSRREFMRARRPEAFSDSTVRQQRRLDRLELEFLLDSLTSRSEELVFERFCRKLLQREVCPNLLPHTGPTGGGDSKVDTETYPVSGDLAIGWYVGTQAASSERWAFAISAKKAWSPKVRSDVKKIAETGRGYSKIFFVSNQAIPDKKRAQAEDALTKKHAVDVRIFDRTWILDSVFSGRHEALAVEEFGLANSLLPVRDLGPNDTAREKELAGLEERIRTALSERRHGPALVDDCIEAALLARSLERPRTEVDGLFVRAARTAGQHGSQRQRVEAHYQHAWATFWWYDDLTTFSDQYSAVEALAKDSANVYDLEQLSNLWTCLKGAVSAGDIDAGTCRLEERAELLASRLERIAGDSHRPSASLQAETIMLLMRLERSAPDAVPEVLRSLDQVVRRSEGLVGYPLRPLITLVRELGDMLSRTPGFDSLFETIVEVATRRDGEISGAQLLLERGVQQLEQDQPYAAIRTLGRVLVSLYKHETRREIVLALYHCGVAYERVGLLWAARGTFVTAASIASDDLWAYGNVTVSQAACYERMKWIELRLGRIPHLLAWHELAATVGRVLEAKGHQPDNPIQATVEFAAILGIHFLRADLPTLSRLEQLPDTLNRQGLEISAAALLFALGHVDMIPGELLDGRRDEKELHHFFEAWLNQPAAADIAFEPQLLDGDTILLRSTVLGCEVRVEVDNEPPCTDLAESLVAALEALLATALREGVAAREPRVTIEVRKDQQANEPFDFEVTERLGRPHVVIRTPGFDAHSISRELQARLKDRTFEVVVHLVGRAFFVPDAKKTFTALFRDERANDRAINFTSTFVVLRNVLGAQPKTALNHWLRDGTRYELKRTTTWRGATAPVRPEPSAAEPARRQEQGSGPPDPDSVSHSRIRTLSLIRESLWDRAQWFGTVYIVTAALDTPPLLAPIFRDRTTAGQIFRGLVEDLGERDPDNRLRVTIIRGVLAENPHAYRVLIGSNVPRTERGSDDDVLFMVARTNTMEPNSDENLRRFLDRYERVGSYVLAPAIMTDTGPAVARVHITKRDLNVRDAWEIGLHDEDCVGMRPDDHPIVPAGVAHAPVLDLLEWMKSRHD
jgi:hypothetical protein